MVKSRKHGLERVRPCADVGVQAQHVVVAVARQRLELVCGDGDGVREVWRVVVVGDATRGEEQGRGGRVGEGRRRRRREGRGWGRVGRRRRGRYRGRRYFSFSFLGYHAHSHYFHSPAAMSVKSENSTVRPVQYQQQQNKPLSFLFSLYSATRSCQCP